MRQPGRGGAGVAGLAGTQQWARTSVLHGARVRVLALCRSAVAPACALMPGNCRSCRPPQVCHRHLVDPRPRGHLPGQLLSHPRCVPPAWYAPLFSSLWPRAAPMLDAAFGGAPGLPLASLPPTPRTRQHAGACFGSQGRYACTCLPCSPHLSRLTPVIRCPSGPHPTSLAPPRPLPTRPASPGGQQRLDVFKQVVAAPTLSATGLAWDWSAFGDGQLWLALFTFL